MCGIIGAINIRPGGDFLNPIKHRGPDGTGKQQFVVNDKQISFGHTRLSVLDLSDAGKQPMKSNNGRWWVTYNGEIYNHEDLRKKLKINFKVMLNLEILP